MRGLVFIDESGAKTNMTRIRGRAERGARVYDSAPHGRWRVRTMISSVRSDGTTACMTVGSATDKEVFIACVRDELLPTLRPGDIVVLDNLGPHKHASVAALTGKAGASAGCLPPCSPDLNPIERRC